MTTKSTLSASAPEFSLPSTSPFSASAPVFIPQTKTKLNPCAAVFDFSHLETQPTVIEQPAPPVVVHVEPIPSPSSNPSSSSSSNPSSNPPVEETKTESLPIIPPSPTTVAAPPPVVKPTKYVYTRQELLDFRHRPECQEPPTGVDLGGIASMDDSNKSKQSQGWRGTKKPAVNNGNSSVRGRGREGVRGKKDAPLDIEVTPLAVTENRYVVKDFEGEEKVLRIFNGILNKLTPESLETLTAQVLQMGITTPSLLIKAVNAVFEKALSEPTFSPVYAEFCDCLAKQLPPVLGENEKPLKFKSLLLNQCQGEFENQDRKDNDELDEDAKKQRQLGTIRFIGELFVRGLLKSNIMFDCIRMLSEKPSEENIEALCKLLRTVGKTLDTQQPVKLTEVFDTLKKMTTHEGLNFRFRFMLQDVIDLRREKWVGRIETLKAKKLSDVHKQDDDDKKRKERQERTQQKLAEDLRRANPATNRKTGDRYTNLRSPQKAPSQQTPVDDGFTTQTQKKGKRTGKPEPRQISKLAREEPKSVKKVKKPEVEEAKKPSQPSGGFGVLDVDGGDDESEEEDIGQPEELEEVEGGEEDLGQAEDNEQSEDTEKSKEDATKSIERFLSDFIHTQDMKEVGECIEELKTTQFHSIIVEQGVTLLLDRNAGVLVNMFRQLAADRILTRKHFENGLAPTLEYLDDVTIDFPLALNRLAELVAPLIVDSVLPITLFSSESVAHLKGSGTLGKWFDLTLKQIVSLGKDEEFIKKLIQEAKLNIASIFKSPEALQTFLTEHQELKSLVA